MEIREGLKQKHVTLLPVENRIRHTHSLVDHEATASLKNTTHNFNKFPYNQRALLLSSLSSFEPEKILKARALKGNKSEPNIIQKNSLKEKFQAFKEKQSLNLQKIQQTQRKFQVDLSHQMIKSMKEHSEREKLIEESKRIQAKEREDLYQKKQEEILERKMKAEEAIESDIVMKLEKFEGKIQKSEELHNEALKKQIERTLKFREFSEIVFKKKEEQKKTNEVEQVQKMVDKHQLVKQARDRIDERINKMAMSKKEIFEKKRLQALEKIKNSEKEFFLRAKGTEKRILTSQKIITERREKFHHDLAIKQEEKRLKDHEGMLKVKRAKKKFVKHYIGL